MDSLRLAQLMCSRLCHDLITPVGAISTGLEIMEESKDNIDDDLMGLTVNSAKNAAQRLIYYRAAFGFSSISAIDSIEKLHSLLESYLRTCKIKLVWEIGDGIDIDALKDNARILINIAGIIAEAAPYGGEFHMSLQSHGNSLVTNFTLMGDLVGIKQATKQALMGVLPESDVTPHNVQSFLVRLFTDLKQGSIEIVDDSKSKIALTYTAGSELEHMTGLLF